MMIIDVPISPYPSPPIVEAMVQMRFADELKKTIYKKVLKRLKANYENELSVPMVNGNVDFQNRQAAFVETEPQMRLSSGDETDVLVVQANALTWSRLAPYQGWAAQLARVRRDFEIVNEIAGYKKIERLGVRYINRIDVPLSYARLAHYEDFIRVQLTIPDFLQPHGNYAWRFERLFAELGMVAIVQSMSAIPVIPNTEPFIVDIDIVSSADIPAKADDIFAKLETMRTLKNDIFELSITDKARISFQ